MKKNGQLAKELLSKECSINKVDTVPQPLTVPQGHTLLSPKVEDDEVNCSP